MARADMVRKALTEAFDTADRYLQRQLPGALLCRAILVAPTPMAIDDIIRTLRDRR